MNYREEEIVKDIIADYNPNLIITLDANEINNVKDYCNEDYELHRKTVSDHVPIALKLNLK